MRRRSQAFCGSEAIVRSNRYPSFTVLAVSVAIFISTAGYGFGQRAEIKGRRAAYGAERAGQVETLLHALFPGAKVDWDPVLTITEGSQPPTPVDVGNFVATRHSDGSVTGVTALEVGTAKETHIQKLKAFQSSGGSTFTTTMVAFQIPPSGQPVEIKKVLVDPYEPLTRITWFEVKNWPAGGWPQLHLHYQSYTAQDGTLTAIEWYALLDMATGSFLARTPLSIEIFRKNAEPTQEILSSRRTSPTEIEIAGSATKKVATYSCGTPCVIDGPTFLARWSQLGQLSEHP
jgi:hypothetical protein